MHTQCGMVTRLVVAKLLILITVGAGLALALPATAANFNVVKVVVTGDPAPDGNGSFSALARNPC